MCQGDTFIPESFIEKLWNARIRSIYACIHTHIHTNRYTYKTHTHTHICMYKQTIYAYTAIPIIIEGQFQGFQRFSSSKLVLQTVESCFAALNYSGNGSKYLSTGCLLLPLRPSTLLYKFASDHGSSSSFSFFDLFFWGFPVSWLQIIKRCICMYVCKRPAFHACASSFRFS